MLLNHILIWLLLRIGQKGMRGEHETPQKLHSDVHHTHPPTQGWPRLYPADRPLPMQGRICLCLNWSLSCGSAHTMNRCQRDGRVVRPGKPAPGHGLPSSSRDSRAHRWLEAEEFLWAECHLGPPHPSSAFGKIRMPPAATLEQGPEALSVFSESSRKSWVSGTNLGAGISCSSGRMRA